MENEVGLVGRLTLSRCNMDDSTFSGIETHLPSLFPFFKGCQISLEEVSLSILVNNAVEEAVVRKQSVVLVS